MRTWAMPPAAPANKSFAVWRAPPPCDWPSPSAMAPFRGPSLHLFPNAMERARW